MSSFRRDFLLALLLSACGTPDSKSGGPNEGAVDGSDTQPTDDYDSGVDGDDGGETTSQVRSDIPSVAVCDGARLLAPPGGFLCTDTVLPETTHFALLEVAGSPAAVWIPVLEQDGQFVTIAPLLADVYGAWSGDVQLNLYDNTGAQLASVDAGIALSSEPVTDAARTLSEWQEGISSAWAQHPNREGRTVADLYQQLAGLYAHSLEETFAPVRWNDVPIEMDAAAGEAVARAIAQHRSELAAAGITGSWDSLDPGLVRGTHVFLPSAIVEPDASRDGVVFFWPAAVVLGTVVKVSIAVYIVARLIDAAADRITRAGEDCRSALCGLDRPSPAPPSATSDCIALNTDDARARALDDSIPEEAEVRDIPEGEVYYDCIDEVDNDGDGLVDCADEGCLGYYGCDTDWAGEYVETSSSGFVTWEIDGVVLAEYDCGSASYTVVENVLQPFGFGGLAAEPASIGAGDEATPSLIFMGEVAGTATVQFMSDVDGSPRLNGSSAGSLTGDTGAGEGRIIWSCSFSAERR